MNKKITFYFVRHGRTVFNELGRMQGQIESPLSDSGRLLLRETKDALEEIHFDRCFASPYQRTVDTAKIILGGRDLEIEKEPGLMEMSFGSLDGVRQKDHPFLIPLLFLMNNFSYVHGESGRQLRLRIQEAFRKIVDECSDGDQVLIVSHGVYYRNLLLSLFPLHELLTHTGDDYRAIHNGDISMFTYEDGNFHLIHFPLSGSEYAGTFSVASR